MKSLLITAAAVLLFTHTYGQSTAVSSRTTFTFGTAKNAVKEAHQIIFYGYDCSLYKVTVKERGLSDFKLCTRLPDDLIAWMNSKFPPRRIWHKYKFDELDFNPTAVQRIANEEECLTTEKFILSEAQVAAQLRTYNLPDSDSEGVGFVVIPENLNRKAGYASAYLVFFDLDTRQILYGGHWWARHKHGKTMRAYFGTAIWRCILRFKRHAYSKH